MIHRAKEAGVETPYLYDVDVPGSTLVMEYVRGERIRDLIATSAKEEVERLFHEFGRETGKLHSAGIMPGDLIFSYFVIREWTTVFVDFGLSFWTVWLEDQAVDLRLIKETLVGAHAGASAAAMEALTRGYAAAIGEARARAVARQLRSIERRGRYARVE